MTAQILLDLVYGAILLVALLMPYLAWKKSTSAPRRWAAFTILGCAILLTGARQGGFLFVSLALLPPLLGLGMDAMLGGVAALLLFAPVDWWTRDLHMGAASAAFFVLLSLGAAFLPRLGGTTSARTAPRAILTVMAIALLVGVAAGLLTAPFGSREPIHAAWHHWGAYLAPVEAWLAGGLPYRDFPIQYGLGPTAVLTASCGSDCWRGTYWTVLLANAFYFSILAGCVVILTAGRSRGLRWLALAALACATFVWTASPSDLGSTVMTPSVAGLRFLPIALLLLHILSAESRSRPRDWIGHAIWLADLFWSPEAAMFGTMIWWPYLALRDAGNAETSAARWMALLRGALRGLAAFAGGLILLAIALWLLSAGAVRATDFLAYILYPPGAVSLNLLGTIWLALAAILLALTAIAGSEGSSRGRSLYASLLGFLAAGTYFLSRSHDNNILNLFPLLVILLVAIVQTERPAREPAAFDEGFVRTVLAAMIPFILTFGWTAWTSGAATDGLLNIGPSRLIARLTPQQGPQEGILPPDAVNGLAYLKSRNAGAVVLIDQNGLIPPHSAGQGWTSVNNYANFEPLPQAMITRFACRGALAYRRAGWLLVDQRKTRFWLPVFEAAYEVREQVGFGSYRAYYLAPRGGPLACAEL